MCYHFRLSKEATELENRFQAKFAAAGYQAGDHYNAFAHPRTPVITREQPQTINLYTWGLIPHWAKNKMIQKSTLNARIETLSSKPSFRYAIDNRCLVLVDGFYEWKKVEGERKKRKYLIAMPDDEAFALAGLYSKWANRDTGEILSTYTIITQPANEKIAEIHSRMPVILAANAERDWLQKADIGNTPECRLCTWA